MKTPQIPSAFCLLGFSTPLPLALPVLASGAGQSSVHTSSFPELPLGPAVSALPGPAEQHFLLPSALPELPPAPGMPLPKPHSLALLVCSQPQGIAVKQELKVFLKKRKNI